MQPHRSLCIVALALLAFGYSIHARQLLHEAASDSTTSATGYTCITASSDGNPCIVNPAYSFSLGLNSSSSSYLADRAYQAITAQHVVCRSLTTQAACQNTPATANIYCRWDAFDERCMVDPYASLVLPLTCADSKARSFISCGRKGAIRACRTGKGCVLGKQSRCFPAWLVSEAQARNTTEHALAEATALSILQGEAAVTGSCPEAGLLHKVMKACPYSASRGSCNTTVCGFSTPSFIPAPLRSLEDLENTTATVSTVYKASFSANSSNKTSSNSNSNSSSSNSNSSSSSNTTSTRSFFDKNPGSLCFPDIERMPQLLHVLLGVSPDLAQRLDKLQANCDEQQNVIYDAAQGLAACGPEQFSYNSSRLYSVVNMQPPPPATPSHKQSIESPRPSASPGTSSSSSSSSSSGSSSSGSGSNSNSNSSRSGVPQGRGDSKQQPRLVATEVGRRW